MNTASVSLGSRSYDVKVGAGLLARLSELLSQIEGFEKTAIVTDSNVDPLYGESAAKELERLTPVERLVVEAGEQSKSWQTAGSLLERLASLHFRRHDLLVSLGGGMICDLTGFVAASYLRGVRLVHLPTTLLAQVDAAIGGKTGVNLTAGKNLAGAFYQPSAVICDVEVLSSLPSREFRSGLAEVIKYGLCYEPGILDAFTPGDASQRQPPDRPDPSHLQDLVSRCAAIKARVVSEDETDRSGRMILNYGHTFGHALEAAGGYSRWSHGEAISVGMMFAANLALEMGLLLREDVDLHERVLQAAGLPVKAGFREEQLKAFWAMDKKRETEQRWILLDGIGNPVVRSDPGPVHVSAALRAVMQEGQ